MTPKEAKELRPGMRVFWEDPDGGCCSKYLTIRSIEQPDADDDDDEDDDYVVRITSVNGDELECLAQELIVPMFICASWQRRLEGPMHARRTVIFRCDCPEGHKGNHVDNVVLVNWPESESDPESRPRNEWNKSTKDRLHDLIERKKGEALESKSLEELQAMEAAL